MSNLPYFDGRIESWTWGSWARSWDGMECDAMRLMADCRQNGQDVNRYGTDLPAMAKEERKRNIWAVRFAFLHLLRGGLCLRPPWSLVDNRGFDADATNTDHRSGMAEPNDGTIPADSQSPWPLAQEHRECAALWQQVSSAQRTATVWQKLYKAFHKACFLLQGN